MLPWDLEMRYFSSKSTRIFREGPRQVIKLPYPSWLSLYVPDFVFGKIKSPYHSCIAKINSEVVAQAQTLTTPMQTHIYTGLQWITWHGLLPYIKVVWLLLLYGFYWRKTSIKGAIIFIRRNLRMFCINCNFEFDSIDLTSCYGCHPQNLLASSRWSELLYRTNRKSLSPTGKLCIRNLTPSSLF